MSEIASEARAELLRLLALRSYERKEVVLSSGRISDYYLDCRRITLDPVGARLCGQVMYAAYRSLGVRVDAVGGPTLGADPLVMSFIFTALEHGENIPGFLVRKAAKEHGSRTRIEGLANIPPGSKVIMVEDVITSGASLISAAEAVKEAGLVPVVALVLVDREEGGAQALAGFGLPLVAIFKAFDVVNMHQSIRESEISRA